MIKGIIIFGVGFACGVYKDKLKEKAVELVAFIKSKVKKDSGGTQA